MFGVKKNDLKNEVEDLTRKIEIYRQDYEKLRDKVDALADYLQIKFIIKREQFRGLMQISPEPEKIVAIKQPREPVEATKCEECKRFLDISCRRNDGNSCGPSGRWFEPKKKEVRECWGLPERRKTERRKKS